MFVWSRVYISFLSFPPTLTIILYYRCNHSALRLTKNFLRKADFIGFSLIYGRFSIIFGFWKTAVWVRFRLSDLTLVLVCLRLLLLLSKLLLPQLLLIKYRESSAVWVWFDFDRCCYFPNNFCPQYFCPHIGHATFALWVVLKLVLIWFNFTSKKSYSSDELY